MKSALLLLLCCGCTTIHTVGENTTNFGKAALIASGSTVILIPVGVAVWIPTAAIGTALIYATPTSAH